MKKWRVGWHVQTDGSHMHVHDNQGAERGVSQTVRANERARGMKKRRVGRHVRTGGSHMYVHDNQAAERGVSQPVRVQEIRGGQARAPFSTSVVFIPVRILVLIMVAWSSLLTAAADVQATMPRRAASVVFICVEGR